MNALEEYRSLGIDFIGLHEGVDTSTPSGQLVFGILASIAELERELIPDFVKSGLAVARAKGKHLGRPKEGSGHREDARTTAKRALPGEK